MPGWTPPVHPTSTSTAPAKFPLHWVSPQAAQQFGVLVILIVLVLAFWLSCQQTATPDG